HLGISRRRTCLGARGRLAQPKVEGGVFMTRPVIFTVGHSTRSLAELVEILRAHGVERLVDVRTIPRSRHNPQFNRETLSKALHNRHLSSSFALSERRNFGASWKNWESWVFSRS